MKKIFLGFTAVLGFCSVLLYAYERGHSTGYTKGYDDALDDWDCIMDEDYDDYDKFNEAFFDDEHNA